MRINSSNWNMDYLGWSGFHIYRPHYPENQHFFIDPPKGTSFPEEATITIFITHGHPEHLGGTLDYIKEVPTNQDANIIASTTVCQYLSGECMRSRVNFINVKPGQKYILVPDISFETFQWKHMPLLPPGLRAAAHHVFQILRRFRVAWRIIRMSLHGPKGPGEMLGYLLRLPENTNIIIYGEGLHRHSREEDVKAIGNKATDATIMVATEPEDFAELPQLVAASGAAQAVLYEPHRPWRDIFDLPHADLQALQKTMSAAGVTAKISAVRGQKPV